MSGSSPLTVLSLISFVLSASHCSRLAFSDCAHSFCFCNSLAYASSRLASPVAYQRGASALSPSHCLASSALSASSRSMNSTWRSASPRRVGLRREPLLQFNLRALGRLLLLNLLLGELALELHRALPKGDELQRAGKPGDC